MQTVRCENREITPSKVVCVGRNYVAHIEELNNEIPESMVLFNKPNSAIGDTLKFIQKDCRFEGEICFLMKNSRIDALGFGLDLTKAEIQNKMKSKGLPWERAKAFNSSAVFSHFVPFKGTLETLEMKLYVNENLVQHATYALMIYKPYEIIDEIQTFMSLEDGDIIMSGTPKGVSTYSLGDLFRGEIYVDNQLLLEETFTVR